jgi:hypothetical protein
MGRVCSTYGERREAYRDLVGNPEGRRQLERPRRRWENNTKMDLKEVAWRSIHWSDLALERDRWPALVNAVMNFPSSIQCRSLSS